METYKITVKKQVKDWLNSVVSRKNQEWLILHLVKGDTPVPSGGKLFQLKGSVLDKLKTDFNQDKRDRSVALILLLRGSLMHISVAYKLLGRQPMIVHWPGASLETK